MPVSGTEACVGGSQVVMLCVGVWHWCCGSPDYCMNCKQGLVTLL